MKALRPCNQIGCNNLTMRTYCKEHEWVRTEQEREANKRYNKYSRDKTTQSFYDSREWRRTRDKVMSKGNGLCDQCLKDKQITHADVVDHIIPIKVNWDLRLDETNLQRLCHPCHNRKTREDRRKYGDES